MVLVAEELVMSLSGKDEMLLMCACTDENGCRGQCCVEIDENDNGFVITGKRGEKGLL